MDITIQLSCDRDYQVLLLVKTICAITACLQTPSPIFEVVGVISHRLLKFLSPPSCSQVLGEMSKKAVKILNSYL